MSTEGFADLATQAGFATQVRQRLISSPDSALRRDRTGAKVAVITGVIFILAGLVKFVFHAWELRAFRAFGLPWPSALEIFAGVLETAGGVLLVARLLVVPVALLLGVTMLIAIAASGIGHGDVIPSLTLAAPLLLALTWLIARTLKAARSTASRRPRRERWTLPGWSARLRSPATRSASASCSSSPESLRAAQTPRV
jgi:uncharacterized membrane protein YphA (DoxX/SURF4 family)